MKNYYFILAQICGLINFITYGISIWMKKKKNILLFQILCNIADIIQYLCLGAYTACSINIISLLRNITFRKNNNKIILLGLILSYLTCGALTYNGIFSALSIVVVIIQTLLAFQDNEQNIRIGAVYIIIYWIFYDFIYKAYVATGLDFIILISNILAVKHYKKLKNENLKIDEKIYNRNRKRVKWKH